MPVFFICFILFVIWIRVKTNQNNKNVSTWDEEFWAREQESNFVRKKDISHLDYIQVDEKDLPFSDTADGQEETCQEQVRSFLTKKMLNLSGMTNTEIKIAYGTANFPELSDYDQNFTIFIRNLGLWGCYLHNNTEGGDGRAKQILEYAVSLDSDISSTYIALAEIYRQENDIEKIRQLIDRVSQSDFYMKNSIVEQLRQVIRTYD